MNSLSRILISSIPSKSIINFFSFLRLSKQDFSLSNAVPFSFSFSMSKKSEDINRSLINSEKASRLQRVLSPILNLYDKINVFVF